MPDGIFARLKSFWRAVISFARNGDAPLAVAYKREAICLNCPELVKTRTNLFCGACGCPRWVLGDVRSKARMPGASCPLGKWS
jgi:hypothetical protein